MATPAAPVNNVQQQVAPAPVGNNHTPSNDEEMSSSDGEDEEVEALRAQVTGLTTELENLRHQLNQVLAAQQQQATNHNNQLQGIQNLATTAMTGRDAGEILKPNAPEPFDGTPAKLQMFLTQMRAYMNFFPTQFARDDTKVQFAAGKLKGIAGQWFEPIMREYTNVLAEEWTSRTARIYGNYLEFENALRMSFGTINEKGTAERKIKTLKQTRSASEYATDFQQLASKLPWNDQDVLMSLFWDGLKQEVRMELYKQDRPATLVEYIGQAVKIDDMLFAIRKMNNPGYGKNQGNRPRYDANSGRRRYASTAHGTAPGPMEIGTMSRRDYSKVTCWNCGKKGHTSRKCQAPTTNDKFKPVPEGTKTINTLRRNPGTTNKPTWHECQKWAEQLSQLSDEELKEYLRARREGFDPRRWTAGYADSTFTLPSLAHKRFCGQDKPEDCDNSICIHHSEEFREKFDTKRSNEQWCEPLPNHTGMHWTACYDDACLIHRDGKDNGYYPRMPKTRMQEKELPAKTVAVTKKRHSRRSSKPDVTNDGRIPFNNPMRRRPTIEEPFSGEDIPDNQQGLLPLPDESTEYYEGEEVWDEDNPTTEQPQWTQLLDNIPVRSQQKHYERIFSISDYQVQIEASCQGIRFQEQVGLLDYCKTGTHAEKLRLSEAPKERYNTQSYAKIPIKVKPNETVRLNEVPQGVYEDNATLLPGQPGHDQISWISCIYPMCEEHRVDKEIWGLTPERTAGQPIKQPYTKTEMRSYQPRYYFPEAGVLILQDLDATLAGCADIPANETCTNEHCAKHMAQKAREWHRTRTRNNQNPVGYAHRTSKKDRRHL